jgi:hypothetical protein
VFLKKQFFLGIIKNVQDGSFNYVLKAALVLRYKADKKTIIYLNSICNDHIIGGGS